MKIIHNINTQKGHTTSRSDKTSNLIRPFIREGLLVKITPPLDDDKAIEIGNLIIENWYSWLDDYLEMIAEVSNENIDNLRFIEDHHIIPKQEARALDKWDALARVIDFPRLQCFRDKRVIFDTRICFSLCTKDAYSSKLWSRVGLCESEDPYGVTVKDLPILTRKYKEIAASSCEWAFQKAKEILGTAIKKRSSLEISSYGIKDKSLKDYFERITDERIPLSELIKDTCIESKLLIYLDNILDTENSIQKFINTKESGKFLWFTSPIYIETINKEVEVREVLYLMRSVGNKDEAVGLRYDDSLHGDLARKSALEVARWLGSKI